VFLDSRLRPLKLRNESIIWREDWLTNSDGNLIQEQSGIR
jgi:hypothetical protein